MEKRDIKKRVCFIAQFPPPIHGLSKAVDTLYNSELKNEFEFEKVNLTDNRKFLYNFLLIFKSNADLFYFTISQTKGGNLRDLVILKLLHMQHKKCLIHLHGGYYRQLVDHDMSKWQRKANYKAINRVDGVIVLGESLKPNFKGMLPDEKIFVVPNCVDDQYLMSDEEFEEKIHTLPDRKVKHVLYLSNFIRTKGYPEVLEMAKFEKERVDNGGERKLHFDFAGKFFNKKEKDYFFQYILENNLNDYVSYHGVVDGDGKKKLLKECDIFVLLTRYPKEGQPISILEAMGNGMFIVTTDQAGIPDIVHNDVNGFVCKEESVVSIYLEIIELTLKSYMICNREAVILNFRESNYVRKMDKVFQRLLLSD